MGITKESIAREFAHSGYDDIKNYLSFRTEKVFVGYDEDHKPIYDYRTIVDMKDSDTIDTRNIQEVSVGSKGEFKFKLYSKTDALTTLGKHLGMFTDKSEVKMTGQPSRTTLNHSVVTKKKKRTMINLRDPKAYIETFLKIQTKNGSIVPFKLNPAQLKLYGIIQNQRAQKKPVRVIVLKARQLGFSTLTEALIFQQRDIRRC